MKRRSLIFALGMVVLLVLFWIGGVNAVVYVISLLGVPIVSGALARLHWIRFWLAALAFLAVVAGQGRYAGQPRAGSYPRQEPIKGWQQSALREPTAFPPMASTPSIECVRHG
jgi:hypothetical protein